MNVEKTTEKEPVNTPNEENQTGEKNEKIETKTEKKMDDADILESAPKTAEAEPEKTESAKVETQKKDEKPEKIESAETEPQKTDEKGEKPEKIESAETEPQKTDEKGEKPEKIESAEVKPEAKAQKEAQLKAQQKEEEAKAQKEAQLKAQQKEEEAKAQKEAQLKAQQEEEEAKAKEIFEKMKPIQSLFGKKVGMTQVFSENGDCLPVTLLQLGPVFVIQKKTLEKDGYEAVQVGFEELPQNRAKKLNKPKKGQMSKTKSYRYLREVAASEIEKIEIGQKFDVVAFQKGTFVDVIGVSKGRGFAGVIKRHNFSGGPKSHGSHLHRSTGSIGASAYPAKVFKNRKMPGHYGFSRVTVQNLQIVQIIREDNLLLVKGAVPGPNGRLVEVRRAIKNKLIIAIDGPAGVGKSTVARLRAKAFFWF